MSNAPNFHVVLHQPEIPHNTGNVGRTCVAIGAKLWLVRPLGFRMDNHYLKRAGLDYWDHLDWTVKDDWDSLRQATATRPYWRLPRLISYDDHGWGGRLATSH